jgi:hypothetical protein
MSVEGLSGLVNRIIAWADRLQRKHGVLGFPYAVVKKYGDDEGGRQAALITYYGFLAYQTMNHVAAVRYRLRAGFLSRYVPAAPGQRGTAPAGAVTGTSRGRWN